MASGQGRDRAFSGLRFGRRNGFFAAEVAIDLVGFAAHLTNPRARRSPLTEISSSPGEIGGATGGGVEARVGVGVGRGIIGGVIGKRDW